MSYGGIFFEHAWVFQIKCMMASQYGGLVRALAAGDRKGVIASCLRLGWNDAFRHVSENNSEEEIIAGYNKGNSDEIDTDKKLCDKDREKVIMSICYDLVDSFEEYAVIEDTDARLDRLKAMITEKTFTDKVGIYKKADSEKHPLCVGHIQKMFNIAMKLLVCLILSAEHAGECGLNPLLYIKKDGAEVRLCDFKLLSYETFPYTFRSADCPVDNIVLTALDKKEGVTPLPRGKHYYQIAWSKMGADEEKNSDSNYITIQSEISKVVGEGNSNLLFDFENWNFSDDE